MIDQQFSVMHTDGETKSYHVVDSEDSPEITLLNIDRNNVYTVYCKVDNFSGHSVNMSAEAYYEIAEK